MPPGAAQGPAKVVTPENIELGKTLFIGPRNAPNVPNPVLNKAQFRDGRAEVRDLSVAVGNMAESQLGEALAPEETAQLVAFLESLASTLQPVCCRSCRRKR